MSIVERPSRLAIERVAWEAGTPYRFTVEQYHRMIAAAVLDEDEHVELLEGQLILMPPIGPIHRRSVHLLSKALRPLLPPEWDVLIQQPITLTASEPEPDISVVRAEACLYEDRHPDPGDVGLVIEVADSTLEHDRRQKLAIYAAAGIRQYWIVNVLNRQVEVYTKPQPAGRRRTARYGKRRVVDERDVLDLVLVGQNVGELRVSQWLSSAADS